MLANPWKQQPAARKIIIKLYTPHTGQAKIHESKARFRIVCCGRRFGKTYLAANEAIDFAAKHPNTLTAWITPSYKQSKIAYRLIRRALHKIAKWNDTELRIELPNGSVIAFFSAENYDALRGNGFHFVIMDESADIRPEAWREVIRPAIADTRGRVLMIGTPKGRNYFFSLFSRGDDPEYPDWANFTAPTAANPYVPASEIEEAKRELPADTFEQEFEAVFHEDSAGVFRGINACIVGEYVEDAPPVKGHEYVLAWDVAKHQDYSVAVVLDLHTRHIVAFWRLNQDDYTEQLKYVLALIKRYKAYSIMDATGVGDPLLEALKKLCHKHSLPEPEGYVFNNPSKKIAIDGLKLAIQRRDITFPNIPVLINELRQYQYDITPGGTITYNAPPGEHDDTVIALALAVHLAGKPRGKVLWSPEGTAKAIRTLEQTEEQDTTEYAVMQIEHYEETIEEGEWYEWDA